LSECSKGTPAKGNGEATPSSGPVTLLVSRLVLSPMDTTISPASFKATTVLALAHQKSIYGRAAWGGP
jgi:hypothetical protein